MLPASALPACGKTEPAPAATSPEAPAHPTPQDPNGPGGASSIPAEPAEKVEPFVFAKLPGREISDADVAPRIKAQQAAGEKIDGRLVQETVEDVVEDALLVAEARAASFQAPPEAKDDEAIAEAWAKQKFMAAAEASVTDADLGLWFAERRGFARIMFRDEESATKAKATIDAKIAEGQEEPLKVFLAEKSRNGRRHDVVPDGALVDAQGKNETGEVLLPEAGAKVLFSLTKDGEIAPPSRVGDVWLLILRVAVRPGTPVEQVPADQKTAAKEKIVAARAMDALEEHIARLRKDQAVVVDEVVVRRYAKSLGVESISKVKRLPFGQRKAQFQRTGRVPPKAPMRPNSQDVEKLLQEHAKQKMRGQGDQSPAPGAHP